MTTTPSLFSVAAANFLKDPSKGKNSTFVENLLLGASTVTAEDVNKSLIEIETETSQKGNRRTLRLVFDAVSDYDAVLNTLGIITQYSINVDSRLNVV